MTDYKKLAEALGLREYRAYGNSPGYETADGLRVCESHQLKEWLDSPEGREAVERRCEELADRVYYSYGAITGDKKRDVSVWTSEKMKHFLGYTRSEVYAAALLWLAEQKGRE